MKRTLCLLAAGAMAATASTAALADPVADFYKGKTLNLILSTGVGGSNDLNARLLMEHMTRPGLIARRES